MPATTNATVTDAPDTVTRLCTKDVDSNTTYAVYDDFYPLSGMETEKGYAWLLCTALILVGNVFVLLWRCTRRREQRNSTLSLLVVNLATADFLLGIQMLVYLLLFKWPCLLLADPNLFDATEKLCTISASIQIISMLLSGMITATIAFYNTTAIFIRCCHCRPQCSRKGILVVLLLEWVAAIAIGVFLTLEYLQVTPFRMRGSIKEPIPGKRRIAEHYNSQLCVPMVYTSGILNGLQRIFSIPFFISLAVLLLLFLASIAYVTMLIQMRKVSHVGMDRSAAIGLGLRLVVIAFLTFACWIAYIPLVMKQRTFDSLVVLSTMAISNPLVFTIFSKPFFVSVRNVWIALRFKCGKPLPLADISESPLMSTEIPGSESESYISTN